jgi:hypothetical protein
MIIVITTNKQADTPSITKRTINVSETLTKQVLFEGLAG